MTPQAEAHILRDLARRLQKLGAPIAEPETLNEKSGLVVLGAVVTLLERLPAERLNPSAA